MKLFVLLACLFVTLDGKFTVLEKNDNMIIDQDDDYWYVKVSEKVNKPTFRAYIRFINTHTAKSEYAIDCSTSSQILYYNSPPQLIFRTTGHIWSEGDSYFVTIDEGVFYSSASGNSTAFQRPNFWTFKVVRPAVQPGYL